MLSLKDLDVTKLADVPFEFEVIDEVSGKGIGVFLSVIGGHSQEILDLIKEESNAQRTQEALAEKRDPRNKQIKVRPVEKDIEYSTKLVAIRVKGWRGIQEEYSPEGAIELCTTNPPIKEQILAKSEDLKNFMKPFTTKPASTSDTPPG